MSPRIVPGRLAGGCPLILPRSNREPISPCFGGGGGKLNLMRRHDIKRNVKIIRRKIIPPQNGLLKTRYGWQPWSAADAGRPQPHLGRPALRCGVKITAVAGNGELLFFLSELNINILPERPRGENHKPVFRKYQCCH